MNNYPESLKYMLDLQGWEDFLKENIKEVSDKEYLTSFLWQERGEELLWNLPKNEIKLLTRIVVLKTLFQKE